MNTIIEKELICVNGGLVIGGYPIAAAEEKKQMKKLQEQEKRQREGLADIRLRAGEDALRAAMRVQHQEMEIKKAQRAAMGL